MHTDGRPGAIVRGLLVQEEDGLSDRSVAHIFAWQFVAITIWQQPGQVLYRASLNKFKFLQTSN